VRRRRIVALVAAAVLIPALASYVHTMLLPSNTSLGVRSVEWLRDHGGAWLVSDIEGVWYGFNAPAKGGSALKALPAVGLRTGTAQANQRPVYRPPPIAPTIRPALRGEGVWRPTGSASAGAPPVLVTTFRPDPSYPRVVAGVAWIDSSHTRLQLYPGRYQPPSGSPRGPMQVPGSRKRDLVATFNSGFKLQDSGGGFALGGHAYAPLHRNIGTLIGYRDGRVDIQYWQGGPQPPPTIAFARQNLPLIVNRGLLNPKLNDGPQWGTTLGNSIRVWRSGVGVDGRGNLIYAAANNQTAKSLAQILRHAGAVRAIELDINSTWVSFNTYSHRNGRGATKLLPGMSRDVTRYLTPDDRDFFAVYRRG